jgi:hypothetical protein
MDLGTLDYALWRDSRERSVSYTGRTICLAACRWIRGDEESQQGERKYRK